jgi:membrane associated rhomboid family serine protease/ribosomal protein L40E
MPDKNKTEYDWVELVVKAGQLVGLNPVRTRWKLRAWQDRMKAKKAAVAGEAAAITREHKICPRCRALNPGDGKLCIKCGARLHSRPVEIADRFLRHFSLGMTAETYIAAAMIAGYAITAMRGSSSSFLSASPRDLVWLGGLLPADVLAGQWWRLWTCVFLHGGLMHIGFNAYALIYIMPFVREVYGDGKAVVAFFITGIAAGLASLEWSVLSYGANGYRVSIGASGAICGLIGLMMVWGHRDGTAGGVAIRNTTTPPTSAERPRAPCSPCSSPPASPCAEAGPGTRSPWSPPSPWRAPWPSLPTWLSPRPPRPLSCPPGLEARASKDFDNARGVL